LEEEAGMKRRGLEEEERRLIGGKGRDEAADWGGRFSLGFYT
jgi:hypothetical protein